MFLDLMQICLARYNFGILWLRQSNGQKQGLEGNLSYTVYSKEFSAKNYLYYTILFPDFDLLFFIFQ